MSFFGSDESEKVLIIGLAESGKTTIIKVVSEGYEPDKKAPYTATLNYERRNVILLGKKLTLFDLGGQVAFLDRFTGELAEFIFSGVKSVIFVIDTVKIAELSRAKYYLDLALGKLEQYSPVSPVHVFLHKMDLINPAKIKEISEGLKSYLIANVKKPITFFETSVFTESIFDAFRVILGDSTKEKESLETVVNNFLKDNPGIVEQIQLFSGNGEPLVRSSDFTLSSVAKARKILDTTYQYISKTKDTTSAVLFESEGKFCAVRVLSDDLVLFLCLSRKEMNAKGETVPSMYEKIAIFSRKLREITIT